MKNYYELLEIDSHASKEIIEKAFRVLAKKYHPDTQPQEKKQWAETKFKEINEAYEVLSNLERKKSYDEDLANSKASSEQKTDWLIQKNKELSQLVYELQQQLSEVNKHTYSNYNHSNLESNFYTSSNKNSQTYSTSKTSPNVFYQVTYSSIKNKLKDLLALFLTVGIVFFIGFVLWHIPFTKNWLIEFYENNDLIHLLVNSFLSLF